LEDQDKYATMLADLRAVSDARRADVLRSPLALLGGVYVHPAGSRQFYLSSVAPAPLALAIALRQQRFLC
jgi:hypothetical protein